MAKADPADSYFVNLPYGRRVFTFGLRKGYVVNAAMEADIRGRLHDAIAVPKLQTHMCFIWAMAWLQTVVLTLLMARRFPPLVLRPGMSVNETLRSYQAWGAATEHIQAVNNQYALGYSCVVLIVTLLWSVIYARRVKWSREIGEKVVVELHLRCVQVPMSGFTELLASEARSSLGRRIVEAVLVAIIATTAFFGKGLLAVMPAMLLSVMVAVEWNLMLLGYKGRSSAGRA